MLSGVEAAHILHLVIDDDAVCSIRGNRRNADPLPKALTSNPSVSRRNRSELRTSKSSSTTYTVGIAAGEEITKAPLMLNEAKDIAPINTTMIVGGLIWLNL